MQLKVKLVLVGLELTDTLWLRITNLAHGFASIMKGVAGAIVAIGANSSMQH